MTAPQASISPAPTVLPPPIRIMGGTAQIHVRPWTMETQDEVMPLVSELIDRYSAWSDKPETFSLGALVMHFQREIGAICERSIREELVAKNLEWRKLWGEDLYVIAQAVWNTSISRPDGGGHMGKAMALLGPTILQNLASARSSATQHHSESGPQSQSEPTDPGTSPA